MLNVIMGFLMNSVLMRLTGAIDDGAIIFPSILLILVSIINIIESNER